MTYIYVGQTELVAKEETMHQDWKSAIKWILLLDLLCADLEHLDDLGAFYVTNAKFTDMEHENVTKSYANGYESVIIDTPGFDETWYSSTHQMIMLSVYPPMIWQFQEMAKFSDNIKIIKPVGLICKDHSDQLIPENVSRSALLRTFVHICSHEIL